MDKTEYIKYDFGESEDRIIKKIQVYEVKYRCCGSNRKQNEDK